ncbi:sporulation integral membrane protein YlbJ [Pullulanibacillus sp. KACC 23026]|uniref:sporulation integral membrane protein YlbJ n=1 Tax=Pullulanibacillus sp. KACC 23026 TaxID=3028315 RepID=UPI0023B1F347|nr:sporulation integral membrane protein YlbJ [Pullulanibacillus sp. KACC 23026]WEG11683.1 sporulation integral membrane protein YlbJ [Pullulanibacillus sp. KACC 23026]
MSKDKFKTYSLGIFALFIAGSLVAFPEAAVEASLSGLKMWWNVVFPSLLPFFIISELLIGFGIVTFIGVLFEPFMRPIFRVPGVGGFVFVMGMASGFPAGAKITARLYQEEKLTKIEAERLACFTNFSNPLFMFGVLAVGFFKKPELGIVFALAHYIGNIGVGLCMRFYHPKSDLSARSTERFTPRIIMRAFQEMHIERLKNRKPIGKMLGDAVHSSVTTLLMVGGFIIMFSVFNRILDEVHVTELLASSLHHLLLLFHLDPGLSSGIIPGLFEMTVGAKRLSTLQVPLFQAVVVTSFILGFSGFSIQAQVASILSEVKLNVKPFFVGRLIHGFIASLATIFLLQYFNISFEGATTSSVLSVTAPLENRLTSLVSYPEEWLHAGSLITFITLITFVIYRGFLKSSYSNTKL